MHNNLRSQTQHRLDEDFLGFDTAHERAWQTNGTNRIGVGVLDNNNTAISITTIKSDFKSHWLTVWELVLIFKLHCYLL